MDEQPPTIPPVGPHGLPRHQSRRSRRLPSLRVNTGHSEHSSGPVEEVVQRPIEEALQRSFEANNPVFSSLDQSTSSRQRATAIVPQLTPYNPADYGVFGGRSSTPIPSPSSNAQSRLNNGSQYRRDRVLSNTSQRLYSNSVDRNLSNPFYASIPPIPRSYSGAVVSGTPHNTPNTIQSTAAGPTQAFFNAPTLQTPQFTLSNNLTHNQQFSPVPRVSTTLSPVFLPIQHSNISTTRSQVQTTDLSNQSSAAASISRRNLNQLNSSSNTADDSGSNQVAAPTNRFSFTTNQSDYLPQRLSAMLNGLDTVSMSERSSIDLALLPEPLFANLDRASHDPQNETHPEEEESMSYPSDRDQPILTGDPPQDWSQSLPVHPALRDNFGEVTSSVSSPNTVQCEQPVYTQATEQEQSRQDLLQQERSPQRTSSRRRSHRVCPPRSRRHVSFSRIPHRSPSPQQASRRKSTRSTGSPQRPPGRRSSFRHFFTGGERSFQGYRARKNRNEELDQIQQGQSSLDDSSAQILAQRLRTSRGIDITALLKDISQNVQAFRISSNHPNPFNPLKFPRQEWQDLYEIARHEKWIATELFKFISPRLVVNCGLYNQRHPRQFGESSDISSYMYDTENVTPFDQVFAKELRIYISHSTGLQNDLAFKQFGEDDPPEVVQFVAKHYHIEQSRRLQQLSCLIEWAHQTFHNLETITFTGAIGCERTFDAFAEQAPDDENDPSIEEEFLPQIPNCPTPMCSTFDFPNARTKRNLAKLKSLPKGNRLRQALSHQSSTEGSNSAIVALNKGKFRRLVHKIKRGVQFPHRRYNKKPHVKSGRSSLLLLHTHRPSSPRPHAPTSPLGPGRRGAWRTFLAHSAWKRSMKYIREQKQVKMVVFEQGFFVNLAAAAAQDAHAAHGDTPVAAQEYFNHLRAHGSFNEYIPRHEPVTVESQGLSGGPLPEGDGLARARATERGFVSRAAMEWAVPRTEPGEYRLDFAHMENGRLSVIRA